MYFKKYEWKTEESSLLSPDEEERTLYVCNFTSTFDVGVIKKYIGICGSIETIKLGDYFNRTSNKKKRWTIYFALVTFKNKESLEKALKPESLQGKVNIMIRHDLTPAFKSL